MTDAQSYDVYAHLRILQAKHEADGHHGTAMQPYGHAADEIEHLRKGIIYLGVEFGKVVEEKERVLGINAKLVAERGKAPADGDGVEEKPFDQTYHIRQGNDLP